MIHVMSGKAAYDTEGKFRPQGGTVDHISISAEGYDDFARRFEQHGIDYREFAVPEAGIMQLFARDPNGILIELNFMAAHEGKVPAKVNAAREYMPGSF